MSFLEPHRQRDEISRSRSFVSGVESWAPDWPALQGEGKATLRCFCSVGPGALTWLTGALSSACPSAGDTSQHIHLGNEPVSAVFD